MLFEAIMSRRNIYSFLVLLVILFIIWMLSGPNEENERFSEKVKISMRDVGNQLLLANNDSTSLILPIVALDKTKYKLSFENPLSFEPSRLVSIVKESFHKTNLPKYYLVEVVQCTDREVAYSYEIKNESENDIIPCAGRLLPESCYTIEVRFTQKTNSFFANQWLLYMLVIVVFFTLQFIFYKRKKGLKKEEISGEYSAIGSFHFYPEQNKLVKAAVEINLSKKECELLAIFVAHPNQIIKRDELTKKVWEDHGVFVGRSLDTYISKLRKKLQADKSIKLTNVHGVGYKLEINQ